MQGAAKGQRRYRYYVSRGLVTGASKDAEQGWRLSAPEIERTLSAAAAAMLGDRAATTLALEESAVDPDRLSSLIESARVWIERLRSRNENSSALAEVIERVDLRSDGIQVSLELPIPTLEQGGGTPLCHVSLTKLVTMQMKRRGVEMRMVLEGESGLTRVDLPLLKAVARTRRWADDLLSGRVPSIEELAKRERLDRRSVRRLIPLGFLSPRIVEAIAQGRQPAELTVIGLTRRMDLPLLWSAQERMLGLR